MGILIREGIKKITVTKVIIPLLQAPATIKGFLFLNSNIQTLVPNEEDKINEVFAGMKFIFVPAIAITTSIICLAYLINHKSIHLL